MAVVLIVPGFSGSELFTPRAFGGWLPSTKVWLNYALIAGGGWKLLGLQPDGTMPSPPLTSALIPGLPLPDYYGQTSNYLASRGWSVVGARIDWRGTIDSDGGRLAGQIEELADRAPIHILAHSRGGLVTRAALGQLAARGRLGLVGRVAGLGVPHQGSWQAVSLASGFEQWAALLRWLASIRTLTIFDVIRSGDLQNAILSWPAVYELFPSPSASGVSPVQLRTIYSPAGWLAINRNVSQRWLDAAELAWPALFVPPASVPWLNVAGDGLSTPDQLTSPTPPISSINYTATFAGDGVVPTRWATLPGRPTVTVQAAHSALPYDGRVLRSVDGWFRSGTVEEVSGGETAAA
jgi:hypothetical protein